MPATPPQSGLSPVSAQYNYKYKAGIFIKIGTR